MVKRGELRLRKYDAKVVHPAVRSRFEALKEMMTEQVGTKFAELVTLEETVKPILEAEGIETILFPFYLSYARMLYRVSGNFTGTTLDIEVQIIYEKWKARGLDALILQDIARVLGITIPKP